MSWPRLALPAPFHSPLCPCDVLPRLSTPPLRKSLLNTASPCQHASLLINSLPMLRKALRSTASPFHLNAIHLRSKPPLLSSFLFRCVSDRIRCHSERCFPSPLKSQASSFHSIPIRSGCQLLLASQILSGSLQLNSTPMHVISTPRLALADLIVASQFLAVPLRCMLCTSAPLRSHARRR